MTQCDFNWLGKPQIPLPPGAENAAQCIRCGFVGRAPQTDLAKFYRDCRGRPNHLLGDRVANWLSARGITVKRWIDFKKRLGFAASCACPTRRAWLNRQEWLNNVSRRRWWLGKLRPVVRVAVTPLRWLP